MKTLLEYLPLVAFFAVYKFVDIYWATASLILTSALQLGYDYYLHKKVQKRHLIFFAVALVMGSLTILFRDDTFIKWKVSIVNFALAAGLIISTYGFNKNPLKAMLGSELELPEKIWTRLAWSWASFFTFCAGLNLIVAYNFDQETWVNFKVFGLLGLTLVFAIGSMMSIYSYLPKEQADESKNNDN